MRILAIEKEIRPLVGASAQEILRNEAACVWALKKREVIRDIWFTRRKKRAVIMLECDSELKAERHLASLPLVRKGFIAFEVLTLKPYDGFDRIIAATRREPNKALEPTRTGVTPRACARVAPPAHVAHL